MMAFLFLVGLITSVYKAFNFFFIHFFTRVEWFAVFPFAVMCTPYLFVFRLHSELRSTIENQLEVLQQSDGINSKTQGQIDQLQLKMKRISDVRYRYGI